MMTEEEKKNNRIGMFTSIGIHAVLLILFIFIAAWRQQIPPPEPVGMSINFGTSDQGSGDVQPETEQEPEPQQEEAPAETVEEIAEPVEEVIEETSEQVQEEVIEATQDKGPVVVEEKKEDPKKEVQEETKPVETKPVEEKKEEEVIEKIEEERKLEAVYTGPKSDKSNNETNQGEKDNTTGDQGSEEGQLDTRTQFGGPGEGGGGFIEGLAGWGTGFTLPDEKPPAEGVLEFRIIIDERGEIISIIASKKIGNTEAENFYRDYISRNMRFYRLNAGDIPSKSEGKITLNLKVK